MCMYMFLKLFSLKLFNEYPVALTTVIAACKTGLVITNKSQTQAQTQTPA